MGDISEPLRAIAAPFQAPIEQNLNTKINQLEISQDQVQFHDYRNFAFPALTPYNEMRFETVNNIAQFYSYFFPYQIIY